jgi:putative ABC transport system permease protein
VSEYGSSNGYVEGSESQFYNIRHQPLARTGALAELESKEKLFSGRFAMSEKIRINGIPYEVVGVLKPRLQEGTENSINRVVYVPFSTLSDLRDTHYIDMIWLDFLGYDYIGVERSIRSTLARNPISVPTISALCWFSA